VVHPNRVFRLAPEPQEPPPAWRDFLPNHQIFRRLWRSNHRMPTEKEPEPEPELPHWHRPNRRPDFQPEVLHPSRHRRPLEPMRHHPNYCRPTGQPLVVEVQEPLPERLRPNLMLVVRRRPNLERWRQLVVYPNCPRRMVQLQPELALRQEVVQRRRRRPSCLVPGQVVQLRLRRSSCLVLHLVVFPSSRCLYRLRRPRHLRL
jgi:hypothetical protein